MFAFFVPNALENKGERFVLMHSVIVAKLNNTSQMDTKLKCTFVKLFYSTNERIACAVEVRRLNKVRKRAKFLAFSSNCYHFKCNFSFD